SREASIREKYSVNKDLTLKSFDVAQIIEGRSVKLNGEVTPTGIRITIDSEGVRKNRLLKRKGMVYPPLALNLYPLLHGIEAGKSYRLSILDPEDVKIKAVTISFVGFDTIEGLRAIHMQNNLYPVDNDIWVDAAGNTLKETVRNGWINTLPEDEKSAWRFISQAALSKRDLILDYSLIKIDTQISRPGELRKLAVQISDFPATMPLLRSNAQNAERVGEGKVLFTMDKSFLQARPEPVLPEQACWKQYLEPSGQILSHSPEITIRKNEIIGVEKDPIKIVEKLVRHVAATITETNTDNRSPIEAMKEGGGNCQSHALLYSSFARAAGIPTRYVSGLVYKQGKGFLYHSWAESYVGYWLPVDPTSGEIPANLTHIKLVEGDSSEELSPLAGLVGKISVKIIEQQY
ncbi:MAG: transglutaminase-like domain-containing protein, partial [Deltaproteobacteria bacterium]